MVTHEMKIEQMNRRSIVREEGWEEGVLWLAEIREYMIYGTYNS